MIKFKAGDYIEYGYRRGPYELLGETRGGISYQNGIVVPFGGGSTIYIYSAFDCEVHAFRRLANGEYILACEKRDDPKQRLWMRKVQSNQVRKQFENATINCYDVLDYAKTEMTSEWMRELYERHTDGEIHY